MPHTRELAVHGQDIEQSHADEHKLQKEDDGKAAQGGSCDHIQRFHPASISSKSLPLLSSIHCLLLILLADCALCAKQDPRAIAQTI